MTALEGLRQQMEMHVDFRRKMGRPNGLRFHCVEDLILQHGTVFERAAKRPPVHPIPKLCFDQSYRLATRKGSKWIYCEGYACSTNSLGISVMHAWVTPAADPGAAYDLAWPEDATDTAYFGIAFRPEFVRETCRRTKMYSVLDAWMDGYPLLTGETRIEDVMWKGNSNGDL